jgi:hypothetical protein
MFGVFRLPVLALNSAHVGDSSRTAGMILIINGE